MIDFINESFREIESRLITSWEQLAGRSMLPASPERVFVAWMAAAIAHYLEKVNNAANQNTLSGATGEYLDALSELYGDIPRPQAKPALARMVFYLEDAAANNVTVPQGTLVSTADGAVVFATNYPATISAGETESNVVFAACIEDGPVGNGYAAGQINRLYGGFSGVDGCRNIDETFDGADVMSDEDYRALIKERMAVYSTAGARRAYEYIAKQTNERITEVCVVQPEDAPGHVVIYALCDDGTPATSDMMAAILAACSADTVRPLTDVVEVDSADAATYSITFTYYIRSDVTQSADEVEAAVSETVNDFIKWQAAKFGRDLNPSVLTEMLMRTGLLKRVEITSPTYRVLADGKDGNPPEHAQCTGVIRTCGGVEDD